MDAFRNIGRRLSVTHTSGVSPGEEADLIGRIVPLVARRPRRRNGSEVMRSLQNTEHHRKPCRARRAPSGVLAAAAIATVIGPLPAHGGEAMLASATREGQRAMAATVGGSRDIKLGQVVLLQLGVDYYIRDGVALRYGLLLGHAGAKRTRDGFYGGPQIGLRWHVLRGARWSLDLEAYGAAVYHEHALTEDSLRFNFDLQPGAGVTYRVNADSLLRGGLRWHHLSNARVRGKEHNLGYDGPMLYLGVVWLR